MESTADRFLQVDMTTQQVVECAIPPDYAMLGGRALTARLLLDNVDPLCDPLGAGNLLVLATGLLAGTPAAATNRISVGCKSPLTGGIKESNSGGTTALRLSQLGYRALIIRGAPERKSGGAKPSYVLVVRADRNHELLPAPELVRMGTFETARTLQERFGIDAGLALIGPAGEMGLASATINHLDTDHLPNRVTARGGVGAVMGSKGLKAIVLLADKTKKAAACQPDEWESLTRLYHKTLLADPGTGQRLPLYGTTSALEYVNTLGALPTRNFTSGAFEYYEEISGTHLRDVILARGGRGTPTHACMPGCTIRCSNRFAGPDGKLLHAPMEFETNALMGSNLGIHSFDEIARGAALATDIGLDTIELGAALGIAMEAGVLAFGNSNALLNLISEIGRGTPMGRIIGSGGAATGKAFGIGRVPVVKGQAMSGYDPRAMKGMGATFATSPMGADHTAGPVSRIKTDHLDPSDKVTLSRNAQIDAAIWDAMGVCQFSAAAFKTIPDLMSSLVRARLGCDITMSEIRQIALDCIRDEREFNRRAGFTSAHDRIPHFMTQEPLSPRNSVFDVPAESLDSCWHEMQSK